MAGSVSAGARSAAAASENDEPGEVLDRAVVQVGGDPPPLDRRRLERGLEQRLALAQAVAQAAGGDQARGSWISHSSSSEPTTTGATATRMR